MAEKTIGKARKNTSSKKEATERSPQKTSTVTPIDQAGLKQSGLAEDGSRAAERRLSEPELQEQIRARAYELFELRGRLEGYDQEDWAQAEAEVMAKFQREKSA